MNFERLYEIIYMIYTDCGITEFPIDCFGIVQKCGYRIKKYSELTQKKKAACQKLSGDACLIDDTLYYEENAHPGRVKFSIAHELGHIFLETESEDYCDCFASHFLAPRIMIHRGGYRNADQIHEIFGLSYTASNFALADYKQWFTKISHSQHRKPSQIELRLESIFHPEPHEPVLSRAKQKPKKKRLTKRQREMDKRAAFFQEQRLIYGEEYVFHMLEEQWLCGNVL